MTRLHLALNTVPSKSSFSILPELLLLLLLLSLSTTPPLASLASIEFLSTLLLISDPSPSTTPPLSSLASIKTLLLAMASPSPESVSFALLPSELSFLPFLSAHFSYPVWTTKRGV
jgi:hypothetical protein